MTDHDGAFGPLIDKLTSAGGWLSDAERGLVASALRELAAAQLTIARQSLLLRSYNQDSARIDRTAHEAIAAASGAAEGAGVGAGYDAAAAAEARRSLIEAVESGGAMSGVLAAVLTYVAHVAGV